MSKTRYKFTGIIDNAGDLVAHDNGTRRMISSLDIRRHLQGWYGQGEKLTLELTFIDVPIYDTGYADNFVGVRGIESIRVIR